MTTQVFAVTGLHCGGCVDTVRSAVAGLDGVDSVEVALQPDSVSTVTVETESPLDSATVQVALAEHGDFRIVE